MMNNRSERPARVPAATAPLGPRAAPRILIPALSGPRSFCLGLGLIAAIANLILVHVPDVCYLHAYAGTVGHARTLPEAMALVRASGWFGLVVVPFWWLVLLTGISRIIHGLSRLQGGSGDYAQHLAGTAVTAGIILLGRLACFILVATRGLEGLMDLRDLTPGVGLALLSRFAPARIGPFWWETARGLDVFGILSIFSGAYLIRRIDRFSWSRAFFLSLLYYAAYLGARWFVEGMGVHLAAV